MTEVTRGEFEMLRQLAADNARRLEAIDVSGTRGVGVVQVQLTDLAKDLASLASRMDHHDKEHMQDQRDRAAGRRWMAGTVIGFLAAIEVPLGWLIAHLH